MIAKLVQHGIPRQDIAAIGDADTDAKKHVLFEQVRQGTVRILLGSTQKMGTGTNVQTAPSRLASSGCPVEARRGRAARRPDPASGQYATRRSRSTATSRKAPSTRTSGRPWRPRRRFIAQVLTGDSTVRQAEDIGAQELSYAEVKAIASGNPAVLTLAEADAALHRLHVLQKHHADEQYLARRQLRALPADITRLERRLAALTQDIATAEAHATDPVTIGTRPYSRHDALEALAARLHALPALVYETRSVALGLYRGLRFGLVQHPQGAPEVYIEGALRRSTALARDVHGPRAILNAVERLIGSAETERDKASTRPRHRPGPAAGTTKPGWAQALPMRRIWQALTDLRNQLEAALSRTAQEGAEASLPPVGDARRAPQGPARRPYPGRRPGAVCPTPHGHGRRGHHHAHSPAGAGRGRAPAGRRAVAGGSSTPAPQPATAPEPPATPAQAPPEPWTPPQQLRLF